MVYSWPLRRAAVNQLTLKKPLEMLLDELKSEQRLRRVLGPDSAVGARSGRDYRYRHLRAGGRGGPRSDRTGADAVVCRRRGDLRVRRALLCRVRVDGAGRRIGLHLRVRHARRALCVDHRLGPDPRIRGRVLHRRAWMVPLLSGFPRLLRRAAAACLHERALRLRSRRPACWWGRAPGSTSRRLSSRCS